MVKFNGCDIYLKLLDNRHPFGGRPSSRDQPRSNLTASPRAGLNWTFELPHYHRRAEVSGKIYSEHSSEIPSEVPRDIPSELWGAGAVRVEG